VRSTESTVAKIGRSIKKWAKRNMAEPAKEV
jgi:hypothetical protein